MTHRQGRLSPPQLLGSQALLLLALVAGAGWFFVLGPGKDML